MCNVILTLQRLHHRFTARLFFSLPTERLLARRQCHPVCITELTANALWSLSQTPSTRFCPSMTSYIQSRLMPMGMYCPHQPPATTNTWDRSHLHPEAEAKEELWQTPCVRLCPIRAEGGVTWTLRRGFITMFRCSVTTCIYGFIQTVGSLPPLPPWSGGRSQETDTLSQ